MSADDHAGVVFKSIEADNHIGLATILSSDKRDIALAKNCLCNLEGLEGYNVRVALRKYNVLTCLGYAQILGGMDFATLLESCGFTPGSQDKQETFHQET
jgi:hypothetical protein